MSAWGSFCEVGWSVCRSAVCFNMHVGRANIIRKCELVCVVSGRETVRSLCHVPREAELCLHMYLLTLDPPPKYSLMKQNNSNLFGWNFTPVFFFFFSVFVCFVCVFVWVLGVILVWVREPASASASNSPCRIYQTSAGYEFPCHTGCCSFYHFRIKD